MSKSSSFSTDDGRTSRLSIFIVFLTIKTLSQNISITLLQISLKIHEHRGRYWWNKLEPSNAAASEIGNGVISTRCHCNPDYNKFSPLSNTTMVAIFRNLCLWCRSLCSNLGGIDPEKLHRATLTPLLRWRNKEITGVVSRNLSKIIGGKCHLNVTKSYK